MFITFEGGEGSGKTTLIQKLKDQLTLDGYDVLVTREPGGSKIAEDIRSILLDKNNTELTSHTEALLFAAARAQHLDEVIRPALAKKQIVLCDRYFDSSVAYQAYGRSLGLDFIEKINTYALAYMPDLTFYLALDPKIGSERVTAYRGHKIDRLDLETRAFHDRVKEGFDMIYQNHPNRVKRIDASQDIDTIYHDVCTHIKTKL